MMNPNQVNQIQFTITMNRFLFGAVLFVFVCGCGRDRPTSNGAPDLGADVHFLVRFYPAGEGDLKNERSINPSSDDVSTAFESIDWPNVDGWTGIELSRSNPNYTKIKVEGTGTEQVKMEFSEFPRSGSKWIHGFAPRVSIGDAKKVLYAFLVKDESYRTIVPMEFD